VTAARYYLDVDDRLWEESDVDEGVQLVHRLGPDGGDVLPLTTVEEFHGPLTVLVPEPTP
jgi:hypothetical protein